MRGLCRGGTIGEGTPQASAGAPKICGRFYIFFCINESFKNKDHKGARTTTLKLFSTGMRTFKLFFTLRVKRLTVGMKDLKRRE